jgi:hypothetical protein
MNAWTQVPVREAALVFGAGALFMALVTLVGTVHAQTPTPDVLDMQQRLEWCREMMGSLDVQAMFEICRG